MKHYEFPGGHMEEGETLEECLQREVLEETGIIIDKKEAEPFYSIKYYCKNHHASGNNKLFEIDYYIVLCDTLFDNDRRQLDENEKAEDYECHYIKVDELMSVLLESKKTTLENTYHASSVEEAYYNGDYLKDVHKGNGEDPYSILDMYIFTAKLSINNESNYDVVYCAASYIVVNDTYYFLKEERESIRSLAAQSIGRGTSELSDDALTILKGNYVG